MKTGTREKDYFILEGAISISEIPTGNTEILTVYVLQLKT